MNDWIVANINNPDFTTENFIDIANMDTSNTQMLKKEDYLKSNFIKTNPLFLDDSGSFSKEKFDKFYDIALLSFQEFQQDTLPHEMDLGIFDIDITSESKVKELGFSLSKNFNPDRQKVGIEGVNIWSNPEKSKSELAQTQKIWDSKNNKYLDYSPNDIAFTESPIKYIKQLFKDPLVRAQWEEDGTHIDPITGVERKHKRGEDKINEEGTYYYETLGGRSPIGKQILSSFDILTVDGKGINKYDFFDSDDIEKSVGGVIAKNVASLLPIFIGGPVGVAYSTAIIAKEMAKSLPMLYNVATMLADEDTTPKWMNKVAALGQQFSTGTSDYAKQHTFSFENFGNLIADVALQWGQQKTIANAINKLRGSNKYITNAETKAKALYKVKTGQLAEEGWDKTEIGNACLKMYMPKAYKQAQQAGQLGRDASLMYMSIISNSDVFSDALEHGASRGEAAAVALGSTLGMFILDKKLGLGELFFDDATEESLKAARSVVKKELQELRPMFENIRKSNIPETQKLLKQIKLASEASKKVLSNFSEDLKYHTTGFLGKAIGEGLEEVGEELISDTSKGIYELAGKLGFNTQSKDLGAWDNAFDRYTMSFLGGAIGGGIFYGKEVLSGNIGKNKFDEELATLIRNGHSDDVRKVVEQFRSKGKFGSTTVSGKESQIIDGKSVWMTAKKRSESQNDIIADLILQKVNSLEAVINNNQLGLSDDQLFTQMIMGDRRYAMYQELAPVTNYYQDYNNVMQEVLEAENNLYNARHSVDGTPTGASLGDQKRPAEFQEQYSQNIQKWQDKYNQAIEKRNQFLSGDSSIDYMRKLNFALDPILSKPFLPITTQQIWEEEFGEKKMSEVSEEELQKFFNSLAEKRKTVVKERLTAAWDRFKKLEELASPELQALQEQAPQFKKWYDTLQDSFKSIELPKQIEYKDRLEGETDEEYNSINSKLVDPITGDLESDEDFQLRFTNRVQKIRDINKQKVQQYVDQLNNQLAKVNYQLDPITARKFKRASFTTKRRIISNSVNQFNIPYSIKQLLQNLDVDLNNVDSIRENIKTSIQNEIISNLNKRLDEVEDLEITFNDGSTSSFIDIIDFLEDITIDDIIADPTMLDSGNEDSETLTDKSKLQIVELLNNLQSSLGQVNIYDLLTMRDLQSQAQPYIDTSYSIVANQVEQVLSEISTNPLYSYLQSIKENIKNPIVEMIKSFSGKILDGKTIPEIENILKLIEDNYQNLEDISDLTLDDTQMQNLIYARDLLELVNTYTYAASSNVNTMSTFGHNKMFNEFAKNHQQLIKNWNPLSEIDTDFGVLYNQQINKYIDDLNYWIDLSNKNTINKRKQFKEIDKSFSISQLELLQNNNFKVKINDKEYDLLKNVTIDLNNPRISLFNSEKSLYFNFQNALRESGLSTSQFLKESGILKQLGIDDVKSQKTAELSRSLTYKDFTNYDKLIYIAQALTLDPVEFTTNLKRKALQDKKTAPITVQEYAARVALASTNQQFRDIIKEATRNTEESTLTNTVFIPGVAGAGKTQVVGRTISEVFPESIIAVGPTNIQATSLKESLGIQKSLTITDLLRNILGDQLYNDISSSIQKVSYNNTTKSFSNPSEYFDIWEGTDQLAKTKLKKELTFNTLEGDPKIIMIDEATHLNSIWAQVLDQYARQKGGQVVLLGDPNQRGYSNQNNGIGNVRESDLFIVRTPKLRTSLRDNNIQKQSNLSAVNSLLDQVLQNFVNLSEEELEGYWPTVKNIMSKFNFKVYNNQEINGDLITPTLTKEIALKLKKEGKTVGFIGNKNNSQAYTTLVESGITPTTLTIDEMQGQEFDYVVIDHDFKAPSLNYTIKNFIQDLYTLMSRGREASIFIDNGLSSIIGKNSISTYQAKAPSLTDIINGTSAIDELRTQKLEILDQLDLTPLEIQKPTSVVQEEFVDPNEKDPDEKSNELLDQISQEEMEIQLDREFSEFNIMSFGDVMYTGVGEGSQETREYNGEKYTAKPWVIKKPQNGSLRNLQAILPEGSAFWYKDKLSWQKELTKLRSFLIFDHSWDEKVFGSAQRILPACISNNFNKSDWEKGTYEVEIRTPNDEALPLRSSMPKAGKEYKGKEYIVDIVFKVKNKQGRECIFDLGGLNYPKVLKEKLPIIEENLKKRLAKDPENPKLKNMLSTMNQEADKYGALFDSWINQFNKTGAFSLDVSKAIIKDNITWFSKRLGENNTIRLGGTINPETGEADFINLKSQFPHIVFSDVYTYASKELTDIDPSIRGKAVVFYSSDTLLSPSELIKRYLEQKADPTNHKPRVRMMVLGNYGMSLSQLIGNDFSKKFESGNDSRKLYRANFLGIEMFTSLWNARASLIQLNRSLGKWMADNGYASIDKLLEAQNYLYRNPSANKEEYLPKQGLTENDLQNLENFNKEICKNIPMFRIGYNKNGNGFSIQSLTTSGSTIYSKDKANLIVVTPERASQFQQMLNEIFNSIVENPQRETLGLSLVKEDGTTKWREDEIIDIKQASHRRTLSNVIKLDSNKHLSIQFDGKEIAYPRGSEWSAIPNLISSIVRTLTYYQYNPDQLTGTSQESAKIRIYNKENKEEEYTILSSQIGHWFDGTAPLLKIGDSFDTSLWNLLELVFHGTVEGVHEDAQKADDARFKNGFFINPDISRKKSGTDDHEIVKFQNGNLLFYAIETNEGLFTSDSNPRSAGVSLSISSLLEEVKKEEEKEVKKEEGLPTNLGRLKEELFSMGITESNSPEEIINSYNETNTQGIHSSIETIGEDILDVPYSVFLGEDGDAHFKTLREHLQQLVGEITSSKVSGNTILIKTSSGNYIFNNGKLNKEVSVSENRFSQKLEDGTSVFSALNKILNDSDLDNIDQFQGELNRIKILDNEDIIKQSLQEMKDQEEYDDILMMLEDDYPEIYSKIFEC